MNEFMRMNCASIREIYEYFKENAYNYTGVEDIDTVCATLTLAAILNLALTASPNKKA